MKSGFQLPDNYWNDFKDRLDQRMEEQDKLSADKGLDVSSGYQVPANYFDNFQVDVDQERTTFTKKVILAVAAVLVLAFSVGIAINPFASSSDQMDLSDIKDEQINRYINDQDINEEVLEEYSNHQNSDFELNNAIQKIDKQEIFSYFSDQLNDLYAYEE